MMRADSPPWSPASAPIWAHVSGYARPHRLNKPLAFLHAYTDDSASEKGDRRLFMAGYLNRAENWALFSDAWDEQLRAAPSIDYLKMVEATNLRDQFARKKGWTEQARDEKLRGLARVIRHFRPVSFEFSINREKFYSVVKPVSPRGLGNPHFTCCLGVVSAVTRYADSQKIKLPIDFIFDQQDGVAEDIGLLFEEIKKGLPKGARKLISAPPIFMDDKDRQFMPLQAADMLAWHVRREREVCIPPERLPMANLLRADSGHLMSELDETMMHRWAHHHSQLPGIPQLQSKGQWQRFKAEMARLNSLGYIPPHGSRWKNALYRARERLARLFHT